MKVKFTLSIGLNGKHIEIMEFDDDTTDKDIEESYQDWCNNYLDGGWYKIEAESGDS